MSNVKQENSQQDELSRGIGVSFAIHAFILSLFTLKAVFFTSPPIDISQAVRVDIVGLPEKVDTTKPLAPKGAIEKTPEPPAPKVTKPEVKEAKVEPKTSAPAAKPELPKPVVKKQDDAINLEKVKNQQQSALDKLKAMAALEQIKEDVAQESKRQAEQKAATKVSGGSGQTIKGNMVSPGTSLTGLNRLQHDTYAADLDQHIKQNWTLPEWLAKRDFKAKAIVYIDSRGNIIGRRIVTSSGNQSFDDEVLQTIDKSAPFPAPPEKFVALVSVDGILIGFPE